MRSIIRLNHRIIGFILVVKFQVSLFFFLNQVFILENSL